VVATWAAELARAPPGRKLAFVFLANDITQHSRRRGTEFADAFACVPALRISRLSCAC
jgi:hypothetical protein